MSTATQETIGSTDITVTGNGAPVETTPPATEAEKKGTPTRYYIVLRQVDETGTYERVTGSFNATSDRNAVKAAMGHLNAKEGSFVAVAVSGWHEHKRTVETVEEARWS